MQGGNRLGEGKQFGGQGWLNGGNGRKWPFGKSVETAMMQVGQQFEVLAAHPFFATITGKRKQRKLSIFHPAAQGFGIDAEATTRVSASEEGHRVTPFRRDVKQEREPADTTSRDVSLEGCREASLECSRESKGALQPHLFGGSLPEKAFEEEWISLLGRGHLRLQ
jgi:hypothetical protein